ncbi:MAG: flagellar hook-length control protein FliK, partial [Turicibacter sp.]
LVLKMVPRELGSLQIELHMKDGILTGSITAEQGKTAELLQQATINLDQMFGKLEIKVDHLMNATHQNLQNGQFDQSSKQQDKQLDRQLSKTLGKSADIEEPEVVSVHEKKHDSHQLNVMA